MYIHPDSNNQKILYYDDIKSIKFTSRSRGMFQGLLIGLINGGLIGYLGCASDDCREMSGLMIYVGSSAGELSGIILGTIIGSSDTFEFIDNKNNKYE